MKKKSVNYHLGMIGDINVNDKVYKEITIENISTDPDLTMAEKSKLIAMAQSARAVGEQAARQQKAKPSKFRSFLERLVYEPARPSRVRAPVSKSRKTNLPQKASRNVYSKKGALSRHSMGKGSKVVMRTRTRK